MTAGVGLCTLAGIYVAERFAARCHVLEDMLQLCRRLRFSGALGTDSAAQCLEKTRALCANEAVRAFLSDCLARLADGQSAKQAWTKAAEQAFWRNRRRCGMTREDLDAILRIAETMNSFLTQQQSSLQTIEGELERLLALARQEKARCAAMYAKLGLIAGVAAAILIW